MPKSIFRFFLLSLALHSISSPAVFAGVHRSGDTPLPIPDNGPPVGATVAVSGEPAVVFSINVAANFRHRSRFDLEIMLIAPDGSTRVLRAAENSFGFGPALFMGVNFPNGVDPNGTWRLQARDTVAGIEGEIFGFSIEVPESASARSPYVGFFFDPLRTRRFVIADEAGRFGAVANFRVARSARIKSVASIEMFSARIGESVRFFFRNDGSVAMIKSARGKIGFSQPKGGAITMKARLEGTRPARGTVEVGEGHYAAFANLQQTAVKLGILSFNEVLSEEPTLYRDSAADFIRAVASTGSHAIGVVASIFPIEVGDPLQTDAAIVGALVAAVDAALDLDRGGFDSFFLVNPIASELATDDSFRELIESAKPDVSARLQAGLVLAADRYPSLGKDAAPLLYAFNETLSVVSGPASVTALLFNPYADGNFAPQVNFSWDHGAEADNTDVFAPAGPLFSTGFVSGIGGTVLGGSGRFLTLTTTSQSGGATGFSYSVFLPESAAIALRLTSP